MPLPWKCFRSKNPQRRASKEIDKLIGTWMKCYKKSIKLLLLGAGESGKTTILKQMKILHIEGFTEEERKEKAQWIRRNLLEAMKEMSEAMEQLNPPIELINSENKESFEYVKSMELPEDDYNYDERFYNHIKSLWFDEGVQQCFNRSNEYSLIDSAKYFLDKIDIISSPDYIPDDQDILRCRRRTSDIQKIEFEVKVPLKYGGGAQLFWMFDVGGQRGERRKWIQVFDGITAVLFIVATSEFDQKLREDKTTNRLREALTLFEEVWSSRFLRDSGFIVFLNKQDLLREKINKGLKLQDYFPEFDTYNGTVPFDEPDYEYRRARAFIKDKFVSITKKSIDEGEKTSSDYISYDTLENRGRECFYHLTTATDTDNISKVFQDIHTMIIIWNLKKISIT
ncbi:guanine nucleotide-binding protein G(s) subunit alpha-like [Panonychus citri]|uniref:guanine nucleotide-binding protein G(s) subunit alpha-like n=1 Tax=Panonychus citri TaxID=50023 RepID=UPI002306E07E|nr:guanine nucleotide-binding protein G(s) subunit alpha-like [Panonychus citri]